MSARKTVVFTTFPKLDPPASSTAERFLRTCSVCSVTSFETNSPVAGSSGIWPEQKRKPPVFIAWEYGPIAPGALSVETISLIKNRLKVPVQQKANDTKLSLKNKVGLCVNSFDGNDAGNVANGTKNSVEMFLVEDFDRNFD